MEKTARKDGNYTEVGKVLIEKNIHDFLDGIDKLSMPGRDKAKARDLVINAFSNGMQLGGMNTAEVDEWTSKYR